MRVGAMEASQAKRRVAVCEYCAENRAHPLFVYLLSDRRCVNNPAKHRVVPYIGLGSNPFVKLCANNRIGRQYGPGSQLTKSGAGFYQLELVYGPIWRGGQRFKAVCRKSSRKILSRILRFCDYAHMLQRANPSTKARLYVRDPSLIRRLFQQRAAQGVRRARVAKQSAQAVME